MQTELRNVLKKMVRFNAWEVGYYRSISCENRLEQFLSLFDMASFCPERIIEKARQEHLDSLIESQRRLMKVATVKSWGV